MQPVATIKLLTSEVPLTTSVAVATKPSPGEIKAFVTDQLPAASAITVVKYSFICCAPTLLKTSTALAAGAVPEIAVTVALLIIGDKAAAEQLRLIAELDKEDKEVIFKMIDTMLTKKKFKDSFQENMDK